MFRVVLPHCRGANKAERYFRFNLEILNSLDSNPPNGATTFYQTTIILKLLFSYILTRDSVFDPIIPYTLWSNLAR